MWQSAGKRRSALSDISNAEVPKLKKRLNNFYTETKGVVVSAQKMKTGSEKAKKAVAARIAKQRLKADKKLSFMRPKL
jgi:t-SNARE complex subunit (syntaxin)